MSTQHHMHTAKSLLWFEPWSRAPLVTCVQHRRVRRVHRHRHAVDDSHRSSHLGNRPGVPLPHGVVVAHARDAVVEFKSAGHRDAWLGARPSIQLESSFWPIDGITPRGRWQGCRCARRSKVMRKSHEFQARLPGMATVQPHSLTLNFFLGMPSVLHDASARDS